jgi:hypothetical protein
MPTAHVTAPSVKWSYGAAPAYDAAADPDYADTPVTFASVLRDLAEAQALTVRSDGASRPRCR